MTTVHMEVSINLPEDVARALEARWGDLSQRTMEAVATEAYREVVLTDAEVGRMLGHSSRWETHAFLKRMHAYLHYTAEDVERDSETIRKVVGE